MDLCDPDANEKFKKHRVIVAYDPRGDLQGICIARIINPETVQQKKIAAKIEYIATAFWNLPLPNPKIEMRFQGVSYSLLHWIIHETVAMPGALFLEATVNAKPLYEHIGFSTVESHKPKTSGTVAGMALRPENFTSLEEKAKSGSEICDGSSLPPTTKEYLRYITPEIRDIAERSPF